MYKFEIFIDLKFNTQTKLASVYVLIFCMHFLSNLIDFLYNILNACDLVFSTSFSKSRLKKCGRLFYL